MAAADYKLCDVCSGKVFYDATLNYNDAETEAEKTRGYSLDHLGDWAVICEECAKTHKCIIVEKESK